METVNHSDYLAHYGVLGMKWGMRRAAKRGETYTYKSYSTKKYQKKAAKEKKAAKKKVYESRAELSEKLDKKEQDIARNTSTGKVIATRVLTAGLGAKAYQRIQAMGVSKGKAVALSVLDGVTLDLGHRIAKGIYIRKNG